MIYNIIDCKNAIFLHYSSIRKDCSIMNLNKVTVDDINVKGKRVLVRVDFNVPLKDGVITPPLRMRSRWRASSSRCSTAHIQRSAQTVSSSSNSRHRLRAVTSSTRPKIEQEGR